MFELLYNGEWSFLPLVELPSTLFWNGIFLTGMVMANLACYTGMDKIFQVHLPEYQNLEEFEKRYILKNLTKTFILFLIVIGTLPWLYDLLLYNIWNNPIKHIIGTIYVSTDLTGLLFVPRLAFRTKVHHTIVCILGLSSIMTDYTQNGLHRALLTLTYMSAIPYTVNAYLGLRYLNRDYIKKQIVDVALYVYSLSVMVNILVQHFYVFLWVPGFSLLKVLYLAMYYSILYDDLKLVQYLYYKYRQKYTQFIGPIDERRI